MNPSPADVFSNPDLLPLIFQRGKLGPKDLFVCKSLNKETNATMAGNPVLQIGSALKPWATKAQGAQVRLRGITKKLKKLKSQQELAERRKNELELKNMELERVLERRRKVVEAQKQMIGLLGSALQDNEATIAKLNAELGRCPGVGTL